MRDGPPQWNRLVLTLKGSHGNGKEGKESNQEEEHQEEGQEEVILRTRR
jgi:hypothetical protein